MIVMLGWNSAFITEHGDGDEARRRLRHHGNMWPCQTEESNCLEDDDPYFAHTEFVGHTGCDVEYYQQDWPVLIQATLQLDSVRNEHVFFMVSEPMITDSKVNKLGNACIESVKSLIIKES